MAENKTKQTTQSVSAFVEAIGDETRRDDAKTLIKLMRKATGEKPALWGPSIVGFGSRHYVYESGREGDTPVVALSPRKAATVVYGAIGFDGAERLLAKLGPHSTGKGCLYIKRFSAIDAAVLEELIQRAVAAK